MNTRSLLAFIPLCAALVIGAGCASMGDAAMFAATGAPSATVRGVQATFPPTNPQQVVITTGGHQGAHTVIGRVYVDSGQIGVTNDQLSQMLQTKAAQLGADQVINCQFNHSFFLQIHAAEGIAIKISE